MKKFFAPLGGIICIILLILFCIYVADWSRGRHEQAHFMARRTEMAGLLSALELYSKRKGILPETLAELTNEFSDVLRVDISEFNYNSKGIIFASGTNWLLVTSNLTNAEDLIVGRMPSEIAIIPNLDHTNKP